MINPPVIQRNPLIKTSAQTLSATQTAAAASLAGGIIAASGRPWSLEEALAVLHEVQYAMYPMPGHGRYEVWAKNEDRLTKVYS